MAANLSACVHVRGHDFTAYFIPVDGKRPAIVRLFLAGYPDDVLRIIDEDTLVLIGVEVLKAHRDQESYVARRVDMEKLEP